MKTLIALWHSQPPQALSHQQHMMLRQTMHFRLLNGINLEIWMHSKGLSTGEGDAYVSPALAQQQLVQLMALQRAPETAGGDPRMYGAGSRIGQAILQQLGGIQSQLEITDPETNFLDWYLARTAGGGAGGWWNQVT